MEDEAEVGGEEEEVVLDFMILRKGDLRKNERTEEAVDDIDRIE